eukprot:TRINITY_DN5871_c0_g1_i4.p1 TRINITY_DN5871_c0_g1~~TRINITY_DN5871_c0_g1_i4.p1  ORF type:complete len:102 (+),score=5.24 TRINITY_DN5871_c0_g1_i4:41-307(+)
MCIRDRYIFCCTFRRLAPPRRYLALYPLEPGLSSILLQGQRLPGKLLPYSALIPCLLYTSDAADEEDSVDLGGRRIIKKKKKNRITIV